MEEKIEDILDNNMMYDGQLNKVKAITELLNLFSVSKHRELLIAFAKWQYEEAGFDDGNELMVDTFLKESNL